MNETVIENEVFVADTTPRVSRIFAEFFKLGCTAFGGPAIIAHIRELAVNRQGWLDSESFRDGVVLSQSIPGATAMQVAGYVGLKSQGVKGALAAFAGLGLPAFFLMIALAQFYTASRSITPVLALFSGLQVVVVAVVAQAVYAFGRDIVRSIRCTCLALLAAALLVLNCSPFLVIVGSAGAGLALFSDLTVEAAPPRLRERHLNSRTLVVTALASVAGLATLYFLADSLFSLAVLMLRINFFAFGGGLASLPLMHHEIVARGWMASREFMDAIALGQVTPGPISITGTFVGYQLFGILGAVVATIATFSPSVILLLISEPYFANLKSSQAFARATKGIVSCFVGLLLYVTYKFSVDIPWDAARILLVSAAFVALVRKVDVLLVVLIGAIFSVIMF